MAKCLIFQQCSRDWLIVIICGRYNEFKCILGNENKIFYSFENLVNRVKYYINDYNNFLMRSLKCISPNDKYKEYIINESSIIA